jgi:excisionase family DNA binding protein
MIYESKLFYTTKEVADILKVSSVTVFKRIKNGKINAEKIGKNYLIPKSELSRFGITIEKSAQGIPEVPEAKTLAKKISEDFNNTVFVRDAKTIVTQHEALFKTRFDIEGRDLIIGFNEPPFKKSKDSLIVGDLDAPLNARLITYFLPAVQIARMQKTKPRLILVTGINAALKYNASNEHQRKIMYRNNMLKLKFVEETLNNFFPDAFSIIETRLAYDFMKISEDKLDKLWQVFVKRFPERMQPLSESLKRFSTSGRAIMPDEKNLRESFRYAVLHLFALGDVNLDYDFIHNEKGYCSIGEHQELIFNIVREVGYEILKDIGEIVFEREVHCFKNPKIVIEDNGHVPPAYNGSFRSNGNKTYIDEATYQNNYSLSYYDDRPRLKPHMDYLYKIIPREVFENYWEKYKQRYVALEKRYNEAYGIK